MTPKKRLGRGLDALLSKPVAAAVAAKDDAGDADESLRQIPVELLQRGEYQPRVDMRQDSLEDLASSIKAQGVVQPIVVRKIAGKGVEQRYEIVAGERRWRAAQLAGLAEIPAVVRDIPDESAIALALIENIQRENLNPLEEARALDRLIREFDLTHAEAAQAVGRSRASVSNLLRLQDLSDKVKPLLEDRQLEMGHARALLSISNAIQQYDAARQVVKKGLSVRETERLVRRMLEGDKPKPVKKTTTQNADIRRLEIEVTEKLGAKVSVQHTSKGAGKLVISYNNLDELDGILKHIKCDTAPVANRRDWQSATLSGCGVFALGRINAADYVGQNSFGNQEALHLVALDSPEEFKCCLIFDTLGTDRHTQVVREAGNGREHRHCDLVLLRAPQSGGMDLDFIERQMFESAERRSRHTKIVEAKTETMIAK
jgi:ParB family chromosome partitioning protein